MYYRLNLCDFYLSNNRNKLIFKILKSQQVMKAQKLWIVSLIMIMFFSIDLSAQRQGRGMNQPRGVCMDLPDLTEQQEEQINALRIKQIEKSNLHRAKMDELRTKKRSLGLENNPNMNAINSIIDEMSAEQTQHMKDVEQHRQNIRKLLTDEQRVVFDSRPARGPRGGGKGRPGFNPDCPRGNGQGYGPGQGRGRRQ